MDKKAPQAPEGFIEELQEDFPQGLNVEVCCNNGYTFTGVLEYPSYVKEYGFVVSGKFVAWQTFLTIKAL